MINLQIKRVIKQAKNSCLFLVRNKEVFISIIQKIISIFIYVSFESFFLFSFLLSEKGNLEGFTLVSLEAHCKYFSLTIFSLHYFHCFLYSLFHLFLLESIQLELGFFYSQYHDFPQLSFYS